MAKELSKIIRQRMGNFNHHLENHARCFCHVVALILGAGLRSLKLKNPIVQAPLSRKPDYFPTLATIQELAEYDIAVDDQSTTNPDDDIEEIDASEEQYDIDPDDASACDVSSCSENEESQLTTPSKAVPTEGIAHTLVKVEYICRRVSSSSARRADFKILATKLGYSGPQLIAGYGIRWNVAYDSWQRAYAARKVIGQLLNDESDKYAGKSAAAHYYKGYEISSAEWENLNSLNKVLEEFLALTLRMEGDGPTASMVLYEYYRLIESIQKRKRSPELVALQGMFDPMIKLANKYLKLALGCNSILIATILHPAWRLSLIKDKSPEYTVVAQALVTEAFRAKVEAHRNITPSVVPVAREEESDEDEFNYYPDKAGPSQEDDELKKYFDGAWPLSKKGNPLKWWKTHQSEFPRLAMVARDVLACAGSSAMVERTFSAAADVCGTGRSALCAATIERCVSSHIWLQKGVKAGGDFTDCQIVLDAAEANAKFATHVGNLINKKKANKIKHVGDPEK